MRRRTESISSKACRFSVEPATSEEQDSAANEREGDIQRATMQAEGASGGEKKKKKNKKRKRDEEVDGADEGETEPAEPANPWIETVLALPVFTSLTKEHWTTLRFILDLEVAKSAGRSAKKFRRCVLTGLFSPVRPTQKREPFSPSIF